jgi:hypothetical protein
MMMKGGLTLEETLMRRVVDTPCFRPRISLDRETSPRHSDRVLQADVAAFR